MVIIMANIRDAKIRQLVDALVRSYHEDETLIKVDEKDQINKSAVVAILERLCSLIFAGFFTEKPLREDSLDYHVGEILEEVIYSLEKQIRRALPYRKEHMKDDRGAREITYAFLEKLPAIRSVLSTDVDAAFDGDPAAYSKEEIILSYPGLYAIAVSRLAHELYVLNVPLIPRMMSEYAHNLTGIDIHPGATIGHHFFIDHGTGIVIGETTTIGNFVKIYQGVTLGGLSTRGGQLLSGVKRHPTIEDHVTIYSGASILGGSTVIGEGVVIGSNTFITKTVPGKTRVSVKNTELQFKNDSGGYDVELPTDEYWDYSI
ncbi:MAG: serine acetyltransferase [Oscillospiraceae bacterium]|jgi:serine O-acetyltransferase|nr:serine acetyltransferase [Oscillospiraceae bacterium]